MAKRKKKVKLKGAGKLLFLLLLIGLLSIFGYDYYKSLNKNPVEEIIKKEKKVEKPKVPKEYHASLFMVGDALIHSAVYQDAKY